MSQDRGVKKIGFTSGSFVRLKMEGRVDRTALWDTIWQWWVIEISMHTPDNIHKACCRNSMSSIVNMLY